MYPLKFEPYLKTMVWGGEKIAPFKGIDTDQEKIGPGRNGASRKTGGLFR